MHGRKEKGSGNGDQTGGNVSRVISRTSESHAFRCSSVLVTINAKHPAPERLHTAERDDAVLPDPFERVAEDLLLPFRGCVGRVEDQHCLCHKEPDGNTFTGIRFSKPVGNARAENPVDPAFEDRRWHPPPVGMDEDDPVRCPRSPGNAGQLPGGAGHRGESRHTGAADRTAPGKGRGR